MLHNNLPFHLPISAFLCQQDAYLMNLMYIELSLTNCVKTSFRGKWFRPGPNQDHMLHLAVLSITSLLI